MTDEDRGKKDAIDPPHQTMSFASDRMTVPGSANASQMLDGQTPSKPGPFPAKQRKSESTGGLPPKRTEGSPTKRSGAATPMSLNPSLVHICRSMTAAFGLIRHIRGGSSTSFVRYPSRDVTATKGSGRYHMPLTTTYSIDGR